MLTLVQVSWELNATEIDTNCCEKCLPIKSLNFEHVYFSWEYIKKIEAANCVSNSSFNPFKPEFTIAIFINYKPRIAVAILDFVVDKDDLKRVKNEKNAVIIKTV